MPPAVHATDLHVNYHQHRALSGASLAIAPGGTIMGIVGPNGSGKSTLLKAMLELVPISSGATSFHGQSLEQARRRIGYMPQHTSVDWDFPATVTDVVLMGTFGRLGWCRRPGAREKHSAHQAIERVGMSDFANRQIGELSGGQRQRVFLARTLAIEPDILFLDEPFQGVDVPSQEAIIGVLRELRNNGSTILLVHHDLSTVADYCTDVTLLREGGHVVASGPVDRDFTAENLRISYGASVMP